MTQSIEEAAREIAISIVRDDASEVGIVAFARLLAEKSALAGIKLGREQAANHIELALLSDDGDALSQAMTTEITPAWCLAMARSEVGFDIAAGSLAIDPIAVLSAEIADGMTHGVSPQITARFSVDAGIYKQHNDACNAIAQAIRTLP